jgi:hypothetical protein
MRVSAGGRLWFSGIFYSRNKGVFLEKGGKARGSRKVDTPTISEPSSFIRIVLKRRRKGDPK